MENVRPFYCKRRVCVGWRVVVQSRVRRSPVIAYLLQIFSNLPSSISKDHYCMAGGVNVPPRTPLLVTPHRDTGL